MQFSRDFEDIDGGGRLKGGHEKELEESAGKGQRKWEKVEES